MSVILIIFVISVFMILSSHDANVREERAERRHRELMNARRERENSPSHLVRRRVLRDENGKIIAEEEIYEEYDEEEDF